MVVVLTSFIFIQLAIGPLLGSQVADTAKQTNGILSCDSLQYLIPTNFQEAKKLLPTMQPDLQLFASQLLNIQYTTSLAEALSEQFPILSFQLSDQGHWAWISFPTINSPLETAIFSNGRLLFDPLLSSFALSWLSTENLDNVELLLGSQAVIASPFSTPLVLNAVSTTYNTRYPYTRIWFVQHTNAFTGSDATFSINIRPNLNGFIGYRRLRRENDFPNTFLDLWNVRAGFSWQPSPQHSISVQELFTNDYEGINGGVQTLAFRQLPTPAAAPVLFSQLRRRVYRHDLDINWQWRTSHTSKLLTRLGYSTSEWLLSSDPRSLILLPPEYRSTMLTISSTWYQAFAGGETAMTIALYQWDGAQSLPPSSSQQLYTFAHWTVWPLGTIRPAFGVQLSRTNHQFFWNGGIRLMVPFSSQWNIALDVSRYTQWQLQNDTSSSNLLGIVILSHQSDVIRWEQWGLVHWLGTSTEQLVETDSAGAITAITTFYSSSDKALVGLAGRFQLSLKPWDFILIYGGNANITQRLDLTRAFFRLRITYNATLFKHPCQFTLTTRWSHQPLAARFLPLPAVWTWQTMLEPTVWDGISFYATVTFSQAVVTIGIHNIADTEFYTIPIYPYRGRSFDVVVRWVIHDH